MKFIRKRYNSKPCLIRHAMGEKFGVGIDRVKSTSDKTVKRIAQVSDLTVFTVLIYNFFNKIRNKT